MAIDEPYYDVEVSEDAFEVRTYSGRIVAETSVTTSFEAAGDRSFDRLFRYISGNNAAQEKIAMTAPVTQDACAAPEFADGNVKSGAVNECWVMSFTMPSTHSMGTLPAPTDKTVELRKLPPARFAVIRYSGFWSEGAYERHKQRLEAWIADRKLTMAGQASWARYNSPFTPWFLRRNEILIPVSS